jgi:Cap4 dsDNA endonuclease
MTSIKQQVLREFGDHGADTLKRYYAQIEYTAYCCIRMLHDAEGIDAVIPEGVDDVLLIRRGVYELHQVKTRDEGQGPWTVAEALPFFCQQYHRRKAFTGVCQYVFASNQLADNRTHRAGSLGRLFRLKILLDIEHDGQTFTDDEQAEMHQFEGSLIPKIRETLLNDYGDDIDVDNAKSLLHDTWIATESPLVRNVESHNLDELGDALSELFPGAPPPTLVQLKEIYKRLLHLIVERIINTNSLETRRIERDDVLSCRTSQTPPVEGYPDLDRALGVNLLEKKTWLGGFDMTEWPGFHRQKKLAEWVTRKLESLGLTEKLDRLSAAVVDQQAECRHKVCREQGANENPGPIILSMVRPRLSQLAANHFPDYDEVDEQYCLGILWRETDRCLAWWHGLDGRVREVSS